MITRESGHSQHLLSLFTTALISPVGIQGNGAGHGHHLPALSVERASGTRLLRLLRGRFVTHPQVRKVVLAQDSWKTPMFYRARHSA